MANNPMEFSIRFDPKPKFKNLESVPDAVRDEVWKAIVASGLAIRTDIINSMREDKGGRTYRVPGFKSTYQASAPGEAPAVATGRLLGDVQNIKMDEVSLSVTVGAHKGTTATYGAYLEYGTKKMEARPWLRPAFKRNVRQAKRMIKDAASRGIKASAVKGNK